MFFYASGLFLSLLLPLSVLSVGGSPFVWQCHETKRTCSKKLPSEVTTQNPGMDFMACKMTCSGEGLLWPLPTGSFSLSEELAYFNDVPDIALGSVEAEAVAGQYARLFFQEVFKAQYLPAMKVAIEHKEGR